MWLKRKDFPKQIVVGEGLWDIQFKKEIIEDGVDCSGLCDPSNKIIYIKTGLDPIERFSVFLHEWAHCAEFEFDCDIGEYKVRKFEKALLQLFYETFLGGSL